MATMIDTSEAVRCLDIYSDELISMGLLVRASILQGDSDHQMRDLRGALRASLVKKQKEAMKLARDIVTATGRQRAEPGSVADNVSEINGAIQRYVLADHRASEALKPPRETISEAMARIQREIAANAAKEAKESEAKKAKEAKEAKEAKASPVSPPTVNDATTEPS
jgi:hypothetical protein